MNTGLSNLRETCLGDTQREPDNWEWIARGNVHHGTHTLAFPCLMRVPSARGSQRSHSRGAGPNVPRSLDERCEPPRRGVL